MSIEDLELRDLVAQTLESNGALAKIRAELRANIYFALEEDIKVNNEKTINTKLKTALETPEFHSMFNIVKEFLEFFNLNFTLSVYESETNLGNDYKYEGREKMIKKLGLNADDNNPLLYALLKPEENSPENTVETTSELNGSTESNKENSTTNLNSNVAVMNSTYVLTQQTDTSTESENTNETSEKGDKTTTTNSEKQTKSISEEIVVSHSDNTPNMKELGNVFEIDLEYEDDFMSSQDIPQKQSIYENDKNMNTTI